MRPLSRWPMVLVVLALVSAGAVSWADAPTSSASIQTQLAAKQAAASALRQAVGADSQHIALLQGSIGALERRLAPIESNLASKRSELLALKAQLGAARVHLAALEQRLTLATKALARNLVGRYESDPPDAITVILSSHGFADLLERVDFLKRIRNRDSAVLAAVRTARTVVIAQATRLGHLEARAQQIESVILTQRDALASIRLTLVRRQIAYERARSIKSAKLSSAQAQSQRLASELNTIRQRQAAASPTGGVNGLHVMSGGGITFPMPSGAASPPGSWSQDQGVDISAPGHTPLLAVGSGTIVLHGIGGFGPSAPVLHLDDGRYVYYGHAGPGNMLPIGTHVSAGQVISEVGAGIVGISTGPHLEIGFCDASGSPIGGESGTMLALLHAAYGG